MTTPVAARPSVDRRAAFFLEGEPRESWESPFADRDAWLREAGLGRASCAAPFLPSVPGTDRYTDEPW